MLTIIIIVVVIIIINNNNNNNNNRTFTCKNWFSLASFGDQQGLTPDEGSRFKRPFRAAYSALYSELLNMEESGMTSLSATPKGKVHPGSGGANPVSEKEMLVLNIKEQPFLYCFFSKFNKFHS